MRWRAIVAGLGQIGMGYDLGAPAYGPITTHARALSAHSAFDLVGAVDPDANRRGAFEQHYGAKAYAELPDALATHTPDVVVVAGPTPLHGPLMAQVLDHSAPRAVICEKPLSQDLEEARGMVEACELAGVSLFVNYMRRSDPAVIECKGRLDNGAIEAPVKGVLWYSKGLFHNGSHFVNLLEYWLGRVRGSDLLNRGRLWDDHDPEPDLRVTFDRGVVVFLAAREEAFSHYTVELIAENGRLRYDRGGELVVWQPAEPDRDFEGYTVLSTGGERIRSALARYQWSVTNELAKSLAGEPFHLCSGREALGTLESIHTMLEGI